MVSNRIYSGQRYLFLFAHPDDELYVSAFMSDLVRAGKMVTAFYATSGDRAGDRNEREAETLASLRLLGLEQRQVHFFRLPEMSLLSSLRSFVGSIKDAVSEIRPDWIIGEEYEGGHEGHDAVSFCASELVHGLPGVHHAVFPLYHGAPLQRKAACFSPQRNEKHVIYRPLMPAEADIKRKMIAAYASQERHFSRLWRSHAENRRHLFSRELYRIVRQPMNYLVPPMRPVGYETHWNGFRFVDFVEAIRSYHAAEQATRPIFSLPLRPRLLSST